MQSVEEERNACTIWDWRHCPSFCCKDFVMTALNCRFMLMSIFNSTVQFAPCLSNNM